MKIKQVYIRGGDWDAWYYDDGYDRCAYRYRYTPGGRYNYVGFRCCFSPFFVIKRKVRK